MLFGFPNLNCELHYIYTFLWRALLCSHGSCHNSELPLTHNRHLPPCRAYIEGFKNDLSKELLPALNRTLPVSLGCLDLRLAWLNNGATLKEFSLAKRPWSAVGRKCLCIGIPGDPLSRPKSSRTPQPLLCSRAPPCLVGKP